MDHSHRCPTQAAARSPSATIFLFALPESAMTQLAYRRILLKLSGEALMGAEDYGIDPLIHL